MHESAEKQILIVKFSHQIQFVPNKVRALNKAVLAAVQTPNKKESAYSENTCGPKDTPVFWAACWQYDFDKLVSDLFTSLPLL